MSNISLYNFFLLVLHHIEFHLEVYGQISNYNNVSITFALQEIQDGAGVARYRIYDRQAEPGA